MKGRNSLYLRKLFIAILLIIICATSGVFATDITPGEGITTEPTEEPTQPTEPIVTPTLPHIEMKVKAVKVGESNQVLIEMWGSNFTNFEAMEFVFTYNNEKLTPSNVINNNIVENLDSYKYEKRPTQAGEKPTKLELEEQAKFDLASTDALRPAFDFEDEYKGPLDIDLFRYLAPEGNIEAMQFAMSKKVEASNISATDPVLLGKLSFRQTEGTILDETELATSRIKVACNDGAIEGEESYYVRDITSDNDDEKDCTEIVEFTYEKYGSISGTIEIGYMYNGKFETKAVSKIKEVTVSVYNSSDITLVDLDTTGTPYRNNRSKIKPLLTGTYAKLYRFDKDAIPEIKPVYEIKTSEDNVNADGKIEFTIENVEFGNYMIFIDREDYGDYIIKNVEINSTKKDINLIDTIKEKTGEEYIRLLAGDIDKTGKVDGNDKTLLNRLLKDDGRNSIGYNFFDLNGNGTGDANDKTLIKRILADGTHDVKTVISYK